MIYYNDSDVTIRSMEPTDAQVIYKEHLAQNWHPIIETYETYYNEQINNKRYVFIAEYKGQVAGFTTLLPNALNGPYANQGIPEIVDFGVFIKYREKGIGSKILDAAERKAWELSDKVSLGVGLHSGYGAAQRIYVKRGYIPDGSGVWYKERQLEQYASCCNDDDLILYFLKQL